MLATGTSLQAESFWQYQVPASVYKILIEAKLTLSLFCPYVQYMLWTQKEVNSISILFFYEFFVAFPTYLHYLLVSK